MIGANGSPPSGMAGQPPISTVAPSDRASRTNSAMTRVLPTPASPARRTVVASPERAVTSAARRDSSSAARPTNAGLTLRGTARSYDPTRPKWVAKDDLNRDVSPCPGTAPGLGWRKVASPATEGREATTGRTRDMHPYHMSHLVSIHQEELLAEARRERLARTA